MHVHKSHYAGYEIPNSSTQYHIQHGIGDGAFVFKRVRYLDRKSSRARGWALRLLDSPSLRAPVGPLALHHLQSTRFKEVVSACALVKGRGLMSVFVRQPAWKCYTTNLADWQRLSTSRTRLTLIQSIKHSRNSSFVPKARVCERYWLQYIPRSDLQRRGYVCAASNPLQSPVAGSNRHSQQCTWSYHSLLLDPMGNDG